MKRPATGQAPSTRKKTKQPEEPESSKGLETKPESEVDEKDQAKGPETKPELPDGGNLAELSSKQLLQHDKFLDAVEKLEEGTLSESDFLSKLSAQQRQGFFHMMSNQRSPEAMASWKDMVGPGSKIKKQNELILFLKEGG